MTFSACLDLLAGRPYPQCFEAISCCCLGESPPVPILPPENLTIATTGASGSVFLKHFLLTVERDDRVKTVNFIASDSALRVMAEELGLCGRSNLVGQILGHAPGRSSRHDS